MGIETGHSARSLGTEWTELTQPLRNSNILEKYESVSEYKKNMCLGSCYVYR
jgi:hypothetical protein